MERKLEHRQIQREDAMKTEGKGGHLLVKKSTLLIP